MGNVKGIFPGYNVGVTNALPNEPRSECSIAVDPLHPNRLIGASKRFSNPHEYRFSIGPVFSDDGGDTWQDLPALPIPLDHVIFTDPSVTFDASGTAWVMGDPAFVKELGPDLPDLYGILQCEASAQKGLVQTNADLFTTQMLAYKRANKDGTWSAHPLFDWRCTGDDKGWLACDNGPALSTMGPTPSTKKPPLHYSSPYHGRMYAIWGAQTPLRFARSLDGGKSWVGAATTIAGADITAGFSEAPDISIGSDGTIHVFSYRPSNPWIDYLRSTDGGDTFQGDGTFINGFPKPKQLVSGMTDLNNGINTKINNWTVFDGANFRVLTLVSSCCFGDTGVAIAWADARKGHSRIYFAVSHDNGVTWQQQPSGTPMLPGLMFGDSHQFHPQLAATRSGVLGCAMYSYSKTAIGGTTPGVEVLMAASFDGGATWDYKPVTDQPWDPSINAPWSHGDSSVTFIGDYFGLDAGKTDFHVLWTDTRNGNQDLFYCRVDTEQATGEPAPGVLQASGLEQALLGQIYATYVSPGVPVDGPGFIIVGGHIIRIPPHSPLQEALSVAVAISSVSDLRRADTAKAREALYDVLINVANQAKRELKEEGRYAASSSGWFGFLSGRSSPRAPAR
jgi:hypothetical protein